MNFRYQKVGFKGKKNPRYARVNGCQAKEG